MVEYCASHTAQEVEDTFNRVGIPCSQINDYTMLVDHPHVQARESLLTYQTSKGDDFTTYNVFPRLKNNPGQVWRGGPSIGMDNEDILFEVGLTQEEIDQLYAEGQLAKEE